MQKSNCLMNPEAEAAVKILICLQITVIPDGPWGDLNKTTCTRGCASRGGAGAVAGGDRRTPGTNIPVPSHGTAFPPAALEPAPDLLGTSHLAMAAHQAKAGQTSFEAQQNDLGDWK